MIRGIPDNPDHLRGMDYTKLNSHVHFDHVLERYPWVGDGVV
jgi:hypothetical protein